MTYFIILHGPLGSGKSTNAALLAEILQAKRVILDNVLKKHDLDDAKQNKGCISAKNFKKGLDIVIPQVRKWLKEGTIVIFDGCFYHKEVMEHLIQNLAFPYHIFTLQVPLDLCIERDKNRPHTLGENAARAVSQLVSHLQFGTIINAEKSLKETSAEILSHLNYE